MKWPSNFSKRLQVPDGWMSKSLFWNTINNQCQLSILPRDKRDWIEIFEERLQGVEWQTPLPRREKAKVNSRLPESAIESWHVHAADQTLQKESSRSCSCDIVNVLTIDWVRVLTFSRITKKKI